MSVIPKKLPFGLTKLTKVRNECQRRLCLEWLDISRPIPMTDRSLLAIMREEYPDASLLEIRRQLDYLCKTTMLTIKDKGNSWLVELTREGIDLVETTQTTIPKRRKREPLAS